MVRLSGARAASCATSHWDVTQALSHPIAAKSLYLLMFMPVFSFGSASYPRNQMPGRYQ
jgi:hypothetical protein